MSMASSPSPGFDSPRAGQALHYCLPMRHRAGPDGTAVLGKACIGSVSTVVFS